MESWEKESQMWVRSRNFLGKLRGKKGKKNILYNVSWVERHGGCLWVPSGGVAKSTGKCEYHRKNQTKSSVKNLKSNEGRKEQPKMIVGVSGDCTKLYQYKIEAVSKHY